MGRGARWTEEELAKISLQQKNQDMAQALSALGLSSRLDEATQSKKIKAKPKQTKIVTGGVDCGVDGSVSGEVTEKTKTKRQGVSTAPIFKSLTDSVPVTCWDADNFFLHIPGGRILTYNELFSILQYRKYEAFRYKKTCRSVIERAMQNGTPARVRPFFAGPTRLTLIRQGAKEMDRDALPIVFKYFLDALRHQGVIDDDNPNIIVDIVCHQSKGEPHLGMRLERLTNWVPVPVPQWKDWQETAKTNHKTQKSQPKKIVVVKEEEPKSTRVSTLKPLVLKATSKTKVSKKK